MLYYRMLGQDEMTELDPDSNKLLAMLDKGIVDPVAVLRLTRMGGEVFLGKMIDTYFSHVPGLFEKARLAIMAEDRKSLEYAAHTMKSSAGNLGAVYLLDSARILEMASEQSSFPEIKVVFEEFCDE
ncbi:MAG: Hpt domain-containing protein, partial [bacterium]|nr:Hpt domain-containing protein [bacterium]